MSQDTWAHLPDELICVRFESGRAMQRPTLVLGMDQLYSSAKTVSNHAAVCVKITFKRMCYKKASTVMPRIYVCRLNISRFDE
jgi:hypothetical protein